MVNRFGAYSSRSYSRTGSLVSDLDVVTSQKIETLHEKFLRYVDSYEASFGLTINGVQVTREYLEDYLLNRDCVSNHGRLIKRDRYLVDKNGELMELRGIGLHHLTQYNNLHTEKCIKSLKYFGVNCIRICVYLEDYVFIKSDNEPAYGYISTPESSREAIEALVNICIHQNMYIILNWHTYSWGACKGASGLIGNTLTAQESLHQNEAEVYWDYFSLKYKDVPNMLYEITGEPQEGTSEENNPFIVTIHDIIRANDAAVPIMVGPDKTWGIDQYIVLMKSGMTDVFMTWHPYGLDSRETFSNWIAKGIPFLCNEWGNSSASGDQSPNDNNAITMLEWYHNKKMSNAFWKFTDQDMTTSVLKNLGHINSTYYRDGFTDSDLSHNGKLFLKDHFQKYSRHLHNKPDV